MRTISYALIVILALSTIMQTISCLGSVETNVTISATGVIQPNLTQTVSVSPDSVVLNEGQIQVFSASVVGGTGPFTYQWSVDGVVQVGETSDTFIYAAVVGDSTVSVLVTDSTSATASGSASVSVNGALSYSYIISVSGSNYQLKDGATGEVLYQSANPTQVAINAIVPGASVLFESGTYNLVSSIRATGISDVTLVFEEGAKLVVANGMNAPAILVNNGNNWLIQNPTVDGNAANQPTPNENDQSHGIKFTGSTICLVDGGYIYNCRLHGFFAAAGCTNVGIINCKVEDIGWNGICLGSGVNEYSLYAINNEVAHCGDIGADLACYNGIVQNNYIHDMDGTTGSGNTRWGIGTEYYGGNNTITGNTIVNALWGIKIDYGDGHIVDSNTLQNCRDGIEMITNFNTISNNRITDWDSVGGGYRAIYLTGGEGNTISNNILTNSRNLGSYPALVVEGGNNNIIEDNTFTSPSNYGNMAIQVNSFIQGTVIDHNTMIGWSSAGVVVQSGASNTIIQYNDFTQVTGSPRVVNYGTGTQITGNLGYP